MWTAITPEMEKHLAELKIKKGCTRCDPHLSTNVDMCDHLVMHAFGTDETVKLIALRCSNCGDVRFVDPSISVLRVMESREYRSAAVNAAERTRRNPADVAIGRKAWEDRTPGDQFGAGACGILFDEDCDRCAIVDHHAIGRARRRSPGMIQTCKGDEPESQHILRCEQSDHIYVCEACACNGGDDDPRCDNCLTSGRRGAR